jgi:hypothetical protein
MRRLELPGRVLRYVVRQPGVRRAALRAGVGLLVVGALWRTCTREAREEVAPSVTPQVPAFCKRFDPKELYVWGEVVEGSTTKRAIAELSAPDVYCALPSRTTFLPSVRPDRRLMFMRDFGRDGERAYLYDTSSDGEPLETPSCKTRFEWLGDSDRHLHYGCSIWDIYDKEWKPAFFRDAGAVIGSGKGVERVFGDPSDGKVVAVTREGLGVIDIGTNEVRPINGLRSRPIFVRATHKGFLAMTESALRDDARLWRIAFDGTVMADGALAPLPANARHDAVAMTSDGEVFEVLPAGSGDENPSNTIVARTRSTTRTVYSDAEWKKRGRPFVRVDTRSGWGVGVVTSR